MTSTDWRHNRDNWPGPFIDVPFEISKTSLILVDMQKYFVDPRGPFGEELRTEYPDAFDYFYERLTQTVIPNLTEVLARYRQLELPIIHIVFGPIPTDARGVSPTILRRWETDWQLLRRDGHWHEVIEELAPQGDEVVMIKTGRSAFTSTGIDQLLRNLRVGDLLVGGWATNGCVEMTARDAVDRGYETFLLENGCATFSEDAHIAALRTFGRVDGTVLTVEEVLQAADEAVLTDNVVLRR